MSNDAVYIGKKCCTLEIVIFYSAINFYSALHLCAKPSYLVCLIHTHILQVLHDELHYLDVSLLSSTVEQVPAILERKTEIKDHSFNKSRTKVQSLFNKLFPLATTHSMPPSTARAKLACAADSRL